MSLWCYGRLVCTALLDHHVQEHMLGLSETLAVMLLTVIFMKQNYFYTWHIFVQTYVLGTKNIFVGRISKKYIQLNFKAYSFDSLVEPLQGHSQSCGGQVCDIVFTVNHSKVRVSDSQLRDCGFRTSCCRFEPGFLIYQYLPLLQVM